jgi:hypothetical protein
MRIAEAMSGSSHARSNNKRSPRRPEMDRNRLGKGERTRIKHGLTVGIRVPFSPHGLPRSPRQNVHEDHPLIGRSGRSAPLLGREQVVVAPRWLIMADRVRSAERLGGLGVPAAALLGQGAAFVFGLAGLQSGLLRQLQRFHRRRRPTMITLKPGWQLPMPFLDQHPPRRPTFIKGRVDPDDLPRRTLPRISGGPIREPHPQPAAQVMLKGGVVKSPTPGPPP